MTDATPMRFPLDLARTTWVRYRDNFGEPRTGHAHEGIDIAAPIGTPVLAPVGGRVVHAMTRNERACGFGVVLDGVDGRRWTLCHFNAAPIVNDRDVVIEGEVLGVVGRSGNAATTGPHLHIARNAHGATRGRGPAENIYMDLLAAQARDMGAARELRAIESVRERAAGRRSGSSGGASIFAGFAIVSAALAFAGRRRHV